MSLREQGKTLLEIADTFGRSYKSVQTMFIRMREGSGNRIITPWSQQDIARLKELRAQGVKTRDIAQIIGRHPSHIYSKLAYLDHIYREGPRLEAQRSLNVPRDTEMEWRARQRLGPASLTAAFCGDPLPGYSALERRQ